MKAEAYIQPRSQRPIEKIKFYSDTIMMKNEQLRQPSHLPYSYSLFYPYYEVGKGQNVASA